METKQLVLSFKWIYKSTRQNTSCRTVWDESVRDKYKATSIAGVFKIQKYGPDKSQPFIFQFKKNENSGKYITSDELYFELGKYPYPLPSNSMQGMGFCTLTPGEVNTLKSLISQVKNALLLKEKEMLRKTEKKLHR